MTVWLVIVDNGTFHVADEIVDSVWSTQARAEEHAKGLKKGLNPRYGVRVEPRDVRK